ncbi:hypothetical protein [Butyrivibrio sp. M55]|uniref:hypothetical protein n=1 Tax=Butyrivibrio sp. M55 TaxID=1855323 RepID=UPI0008E5C7B1|nr:hypothetical protein [Butyrivibrio sp. M55]SFU69253.1 hypothetical protein SAMN05216540_10643 [Butyrivibrio sp. M55]
MTNKNTTKGNKKIRIVIICIIAVLVLAGCGYAGIVAFISYKQESTVMISKDVSEYELYKSGPSAVDHFNDNLNEGIWPDRINSSYNVKDFFMMYYCPFDPNYLGYMNIEFTDEDFKKEVERLSLISSDDYIGVYNAEGFNDYDVLAIKADNNGFVYAISKEANNIVYVEIKFPGYAMDINYEKYIPLEYLPNNIQIKKGNPTQKKYMDSYEK